MNITLYFEDSGNITPIVLHNLAQLNNHFNNNIYIAKLDNIDLDLDKHIEDYGIKENDLILITKRKTEQAIVISSQADNSSSTVTKIWKPAKIYIKGKYNNNIFRILIDNVCKISVISLNIVNKFNLKLSEDGKKIINCKLGLGQNNIFMPIDFHVVDVSINIVTLGLDFLYANDGVLNFKTNTLNVNSTEIDFLSEIELKKYKKIHRIKSKSYVDLKNGIKLYNASNIDKKYQSMMGKIDVDKKNEIWEALQIFFGTCELVWHGNTHEYSSGGMARISWFYGVHQINIYDFILKHCNKFLTGCGFNIRNIELYVTFYGSLDVVKFLCEIFNSYNDVSKFSRPSIDPYAS